MSINRIVCGGDLLTLRARFQDNCLVNSQASGVTVSIFPAGSDLTVPSDALVLNAPATYFDQGIFQYNYNAPSSGPDGTWYDVWYGTLDNQLLSGIFTFSVSVSGAITSLGSQLNINNIIDLFIPSGLRAVDGTTISTPIIAEFLTTSSPHYSDQRKIRLEIGGYIQDIGDDTLEQAILEASIEADQLTFNKFHQNTPLYLHARREWVTCRTALLLLVNLGNLSLKAKTLADLHVEYDTFAIRDTMRRLADCMDRWYRQLQTGGLAISTEQAELVIRGSHDPDRPAIGRTWFTTEGPSASNKIPASNIKERSPFHRRYANGFLPRRYW